VPNDVLQEVGKAITEIPKDFNPHRLIKKLFQQRRDMITGDPRKPLVDWGMAEAMAFGTLLSEGASRRREPGLARRSLLSEEALQPIACCGLPRFQLIIAGRLPASSGTAMARAFRLLLSDRN
jgi:hypothetical protein